MSASVNDGKDNMFGFLKSVFRKPGENKPGNAGPRVPLPAKSASKPGAPVKAPAPGSAKAVTPASAKAPVAAATSKGQASAKTSGSGRTPVPMNVPAKPAASGSIISKLFGARKSSSPEQNEIAVEKTGAPAAVPPAHPTPQSLATAQSLADIPDIFPVKAAQPAKSPEPAAPEPMETAEADIDNGNGNHVQLPLQAIVNALPFEFKGRLRQTPTEDMTVSIPLEKVLSQLSTGSVKITFGELRNAVPQAFSSQKDRDQIQVTLPLHEILSRINSTLLTRRDDQKQVEVPDEISSPFDERGKGSVFTIGSGKPAPGGPPAPTPRATTPAAPVQPAPAITPVQPVPFRGSLASAPTPPAPTATSAVAPPAMPMPSAPRVVGVAPVVPQQPANANSPAPTTNSSDHGTFAIPLNTVTEQWPEALRLEMAQLNLTDAQLALPMNEIERALKAGKIAFPWKVLRSWIKPSPLPTVSAHDNVTLELPLKAVTPLFMAARQKEAANKGQHKVSIDANIPNLFFGFPQGEGDGAAVTDAAAITSAGSNAVSAPTDTNYYVWDDTKETAQVDETAVKKKSVKPAAGTDFISRCATPNEVVSRTAALDGVAGALVALPDGLMVASKVSAELNGDTIAAFLPHIFGKVSQCTKELRMGELNNLNFTVGNVPWKIFRVNAIFFAVFGHPGEPLPSRELVALAAELDRKKQQ
jgi:predicted regulator of Ras-like GTPase activity (Roadblock/LC7/MglB family)